jgi:putative SbcD/Mre11-related phosphoesterase
MRLSPVFGERALYTEAGGVPTVIVGDLHVGIEGELHRSGVHIPSQTGEMRDRLEEILDDRGARRLVVLGDLKDTIARASRQEQEELPELFEGLGVDVHLVPGNHDAGVDEWIGDAAVHPSDGAVLGDEVGLAHGHTWPRDEVMACSRIAFSHNHPMVVLRDEVGGRHKEPCWVRAPFRDEARERYPDLPGDARLVLVPAFNPLLGGTPLNDRDGEPLLGPLFENELVDVDGARVWTLDGVELGTVDSLRKYGDPQAGREEAPRDG